MSPVEKVDVLVIGAGPAGTVAASIVNKAGYKVRIVEKQTFPRFVIGESLLPRCMEALEEAGFLDAVRKAGFQEKGGAKFVKNGKICDYRFAEQFTKGWEWTWQVPRAEFDKILADTVQEQGVPLSYQTTVTGIEFHDDHSIATVTDADGHTAQISARFIIDGSGYGKVIPRLLGTEKPSNMPGRRALFAHTKDLRRALSDEPNRITIVVHEPGVWIWIIPFSNGITSLGYVGDPGYFKRFEELTAPTADGATAGSGTTADGATAGSGTTADGATAGGATATATAGSGTTVNAATAAAGNGAGERSPLASNGAGTASPDAMLRAMIAAEPYLAERFQDVEWAMAPRGLESWSSTTSAFYGKGYVLTGNVTEFLDPVFSSGVTLATVSSQLAAGLVIRQLRGESVDWEKEYAQVMMQGVDTFRSYVNTWYEGVLDTIFFADDQDPLIKSQICSVLAGYVWDTTNPYVKNHHNALHKLQSLINYRDSHRKVQN